MNGYKGSCHCLEEWIRRRFVNLLDEGVTAATNHLTVTGRADLVVASVSSVIPNPTMDKTIERLDLGGLLQLIQLIFQILQDLGIFGG